MTLTAAELAAVLGADETDAARLLAVAAALVTDYAPGAPDALANEATIRFAGYLGSADWGDASRLAAGPVVVESVTNHAAAFRNSGAAMLLTRYRVRRAGAVG